MRLNFREPAPRGRSWDTRRHFWSAFPLDGYESETQFSVFFNLIRNMIRTYPKGFLVGWALTMGVTSLLVGLAFAPPFVSEAARVFIMQAFSGVCHQLSSRSPHIDGVALGVCHRCFGTYAGFPAAALLYGALRGFWPFSTRIAPWILVIGVLPAVVDWSGDVLGIWMNTPVSRIITGGFLGLVAGYFLVAAVVDSFVLHYRPNHKDSS